MILTVLAEFGGFFSDFGHFGWFSVVLNLGLLQMIGDL